MKKFFKKSIVFLFGLLLSSFMGGYFFAGMASYHFHCGQLYYAGGEALLALFFAVNYVAIKINDTNARLEMTMRLQLNCAESLVAANKINAELIKVLSEFCENEKSV